MLKKFPFPLLTFLLFSFCTQEKPDIRVVCENSRGNSENSPGNYRIKWELLPPMKGTVNIYESNSPDSFDIKTPLVTVNISDGFKDIFANSNLSRSYFELVFNNKYSVITAERVLPMQQLNNFRDLGGYYNENNLQTKWGKLYRSSSLTYASKSDLKFLNILKIKTVIDFRPERDRLKLPTRYKATHIINLPLRENPPTFFADKILSKQMKQNDVIIAQQDNLSYIVANNSDYFEYLFETLLEKTNYPIVITCTLGKDKTGLAAALILTALGVDREQIISDFLLSNELIDYELFIPNNDIYASDEDVQKTMTTMLSANQEVLTYILNKITKQYGSIDKYLETEIKLTPQKREKLKELLLYPEAK